MFQTTNQMILICRGAKFQPRKTQLCPCQNGLIKDSRGIWGSLWSAGGTEESIRKRFDIHILYIDIAGWWLGHPSEKYDFVSWDDEIPNISGKIKNGNQTTNQI